ncbi:MAG: multicopper oxidase domain-containing protein, partial [Waterburya sp.]
MANIEYDLVALPATIWFNKYGDHDHDGLIYVLKEHQDIIQYIKNLQDEDFQPGTQKWQDLMDRRKDLITKYNLTGNTSRIDEWLPNSKEKAKQPHPLIVPLVLRANLGDTITIKLKNEIKNRHVGIHLVGPGTDVASDGSHIGTNQSSLVAYKQEKSFIWQVDHEGVFVFHDAGDFRGDERGTNAHGLFGALIVEPAGARWTDPETGDLLRSGLDADVHQRTEEEIKQLQTTNNLAPYPNANNPKSLTTEYPDSKASFREFVIFIQDEPHWVAPHEQLETNPCEESGTSQEQLMHEHTAGSLMPISYRAEPMISRERQLWQWMKEGKIDPDNIVVNEEQHHSSWLFGDPSTSIFKAYLGDPVRIRLVHAGVKETHVFHLHVYEWNAIPFHRDSNIIDAITISPQAGHTIVPFYGAGNRQMVPGDVIWHCHLYPHFHHGMWGMFRTFDKLQEGQEGAVFNGETGEELKLKEQELKKIKTNDYHARTRKQNKTVRQLGCYPDLTPIHKLVPLPDREAPPKPTVTQPGYPLFIAGEVGQKSYNPPWNKNKDQAKTEGWAVDEYDYRNPTQLELKAFNHDPRPGELFTTFAYPDSNENLHKVPESTTVKHNIDVLMTPIKYNDYGWWDPHGHLYVLADEDHGIKTFSEIV